MVIPQSTFTSIAKLVCLAAVWLGSCGRVRADQATYLAVTAEGKKYEGRRIKNWHRGDAVFELNEEKVGRGAELRFFRNRSLPVNPLVNSSTGILEFANADRVVGEIIDFREATNEDSDATADKMPSHLFVDTPTGFADPYSTATSPLRVKLDLLRRVSWRGEFAHDYSPNVVYTRDGRKLSYRSLKWTSNSIRLLVDNTPLELPFDLVAEIHFPEQDPWETYYRELQILTGSGIGRLYRIESDTGLIATGNALQFDAMAHTLNQDRARIILTLERLNKSLEANVARKAKAIANYERRVEDTAEKDKLAQEKYDVGVKKIEETERYSEREKSQKIRLLKDQTIGRMKDQRHRLVKRMKQTLDRSLQNAKKQATFLNQQLAKNQAALQALDPSGDAENWHHKVTPAWSLDEIWVPFMKIRTSIWFDSHELPVSRLFPQLQSKTRLLSHGFKVTLDRSVNGESLQTDETEFGWGIGVHGDNQLVIPLPSFARAFRTQLGLNESVGDGGCVQAQIFLDSTKRAPLYTSPTLVGGKQLVATEWLEFPGNLPGQRQLILQVIANPTDRPSRADPLDIRDHFDWLEPVIALDLGQLEKNIKRLSK